MGSSGSWEPPRATCVVCGPWQSGAVCGLVRCRRLASECPCAGVQFEVRRSWAWLGWAAGMMHDLCPISFDVWQNSHIYTLHQHLASC
jgi:hypothetical protein